MNLFSEEALYVGSSLVHFRLDLGGTSHAFGSITGFGPIPEKLLDRLPLPGGIEKQLVLPCMPAAVPVVGEAAPSSLPPSLSRPLIKAAEPGPGCVGIVALQSGRRSAVLRASPGVFYRLKGCGDLDAGFPLTAAADKSDALQIRGAMFDHTRATEIAMSQRVETAVLQAAGFLSANSPVGWWNYATDPERPFPSVTRCCGLFRTLGDRRLFTHVVSGLDLLLPAIFPGGSLPAEQLASLMACVPLSRLAGAASPAEIPSTAMAMLMAPSSTSEDSFADASKVVLSCPPVPTASIPAGIDTRWLPVWASFASRVSTQPPLGYVFARLGSETGVILRAIHDAKISWGTYSDFLAFHSNSHPNNLVLVPPGVPTRVPQWLAPLDFDMAFSAEHICPSIGKTFGDIVTLERNTMALSIAGDEEINTGACVKAASLAGNLPALQWILRDTMLRAFMAGYSRGVRIHDPALEEKSRAILGMALIISSSFIA